MFSATEKVSLKRLREDDQESVRRERRSPVERPLRNPTVDQIGGQKWKGAFESFG